MIRWSTAFLSLVAYYVLFGRSWGEGEAAPSFYLLDVVASGLTFALFGAVISLLIAVFILRAQKYSRRLAIIFPWAFTAITVVVLACAAMLHGRPVVAGVTQAKQLSRPVE
jgi:hypothetical protein